MNVTTGLAASCLLLTLGAIGCGPKLVAPVTGEVTYRSQPLPDGRVTFHPENGRPAFGEIQQGRFRLTTRAPSDGALIGTHRVSIQRDRLASNDPMSDRISLIPRRYGAPNTSGLTAEVTSSGPNHFEFHLTD